MAGINTSLQLRQAQTLSMTPQLQQAIRLLQLSTLELVQEINQAIDLNPLLEVDEKGDRNLESLDQLYENEQRASDYDPFDNDSSVNSAADISLHQDTDSAQLDLSLEPGSRLPAESAAADPAAEPGSGGDGGADGVRDEARDGQDESDFDAGYAEPASDEVRGGGDDYADTYQKDSYTSAAGRSVSYDGEDTVYEGQTTVSLQDHLTFQLDLSPLTGRDKFIAQNIIDGIDDSGYLTEAIPDLLSSVQDAYPDTDEEDVLAILKLIQHYDPLGVGSRTVQECLLIQLHELDQDNPRVRQAITIVSDYLSLLSGKDFRTLCQKMGVKEPELKEIVGIITSLNPRPGQGVIREKSDFIIPDVLCYKDSDGHYVVELNNNALPRVRLNETYKAMMGQARSKEDMQFFKSHLQEANWFLQSLNKRNDTLLRVASCIIMHQSEFLQSGEAYMQPLILNDVAQETDLHESTISRITTQKYIHTPRGTFELKYFFSSKVNTDDGDAASSIAIKAHIKNLIAAENKRRPLSDSQLSKELEKLGIIAARRTIAKYREALGISSSSQRKLLV